MPDPRGPAFPVTGYHSDEHGPCRPSDVVEMGMGGISRMDYFAGQALAGLPSTQHWDPEDAASWACAVASAMLVLLQPEEPTP